MQEDYLYLEALADVLQEELIQSAYHVAVMTGYVSQTKRKRWFDRVLIITIFNPKEWIPCQRHILFRSFRFPRTGLPIDVYFNQMITPLLK